MTLGDPLVELWRGERLESVHLGHVAVCDPNGEILYALGDPDRIIYPRSSCKMVQALPLLTSGAGRDLTPEQLALACASHQGAHIHTSRVATWLRDLGLSEADLRCGVQTPADEPAHHHLIKTDSSPCQFHNNCSGKHAGFLMLTQHMGAGPDYVDPNHPLQRAIRTAFEDATGEPSPGYGIDGCSAPNFATSLRGLAWSMAKFANATEGHSTIETAMVRLRNAMMQHPNLVAGETRACTELMRAAPGVAVKTGAEGVFVAIIPDRKLGVALKITDGSTRAAEATITQILTTLGLLDANHPAALKRVGGPIKNWNGVITGHTRPSDALLSSFG